MAFNWPTFWTRAFTALIFVAVMMVGLLYNQWSLFVLISIIYFGCWWEYFKLVEKISIPQVHEFAKLGVGLLGYHIILLLSGSGLQIGNFGLKDNFSLPFLVAGIVFLLWGIFKTTIVTPKILIWLLGGLLYTALPLGLLLHLAASEQLSQLPLGQYIVLYIIGSVWINDTMAYLAGSAIGKTPLSKISPKKTWEGTLCGIILSASLTWPLFSLLFLQKIDWGIATTGIIISALTAISGTFGDLFESKLKRMAAVKDSGHIMPGHGGFLDRFDSVLFAAPAVWIFLKILYG